MAKAWCEKFAPNNIKAQHLEAFDKQKKLFVSFVSELELLLLDGRYKAIVLTKLEEAAMFATKSFTHEE